MTLDLSALKAKLAELSNRTRSSDILWKPQEGTNVVRIVPSVKNPSNPFTEAYFHYLGGKTYVSPLTVGDPDPIEEFYQKLRAGGGLSKEEWAEAKKYSPKMRTYVPVIVRGKEAEGVRLWGFGKTTYTELLGFMADPEYGDITDLKTGRDIKVEFVPGEKSPTKFPQTTIRISPTQKPATTDPDLLKLITNSQPDLFEVYKIPSYDELNEVLTKLIAPSSSPIVTATVDDDWQDGAAQETVKSAAKMASKPSSKSKTVDEEFDEVFNEA